MPETEGFFRSPPSFSRELESVPPTRRRLGWLVLAAAVLIGTSVLLVLFFSSLYLSDPPAMQATFIETLSRETSRRLDSSAMEREEDLEGAFLALSAANDAGSLGWRQLWLVMRAYAEASANGTIDSDDVDAIIESIREAAMGATMPRRL